MENCACALRCDSQCENQQQKECFTFSGSDCNSVSAREVSILTDRRRFGDTRCGYPLPLHIFQTVLQPAASPATGCRTEECISFAGKSRRHFFPSKLLDQYPVKLVVSSGTKLTYIIVIVLRLGMCGALPQFFPFGFFCWPLIQESGNFILQFLSTFAKLRKATIQFVASVRLSQIAPTARIFMKFDI
jgi:hypothetical protein